MALGSFGRGGIVPDSYGLSLTVYCKDATEAAPVKIGAGVMFDATAGAYGVRLATAGEVPDAYIKQGNGRTPSDPLGAYISAKYSRNMELLTDGTVAIGDSVELAADGKYTKAASGNGTLVMLVNAATNKAEVLI